jgi:hypothetical protein
MTNAFRWSLLSDFYFTLKASNQRLAFQPQRGALSAANAC